VKNVEDIYPCTPLQQGLIFHSLAEPGSGVYINQCGCALRGPLDVNALKTTWQQIVDRHSILRTSFVWEDVEQPLQVVRARVKLRWQEEDWRDVPAAGRAARLEGFANAERKRGFDLQRAPLMRFALLRLDEETHWFLWTFHHALLDGWSTARLFDEAFASYAALSRGERFDPPRSRPFRDFVAWLQRQDPAKAEAFWRRILAGFKAPVPLGIDHPPAPGRDVTYRERVLRLPPAESAALQGFAQRCRLTLNTLVQSAWALLLSRYSGESDVLYGTVVSGRPPELERSEEMCGLFINTIPVRVRTAVEEQLVPWLQELQDQLVEQRQYEHSPLAQVRRFSEMPPGLPLFESIYTFENYPVGDARPEVGGALEVNDVRSFESTPYPITLMAWAGRQLGLRVIHDETRIEDATSRRLHGHLQAILAGMTDGGALRLGDLGILSPAERHQILREWNDTMTEPAPAGGLHELFERQARRTPDAVAVVCGPERLTYGELERRSDRLARLLRSLTAPGEMVGLYLDRGPELVVTLLGILRAGCAYVPLDAAFPPARIGWILSRLGVRCLVSQPRRLGMLDLGAAEMAGVEHLVAFADEAEPPAPIPGKRLWWEADHRPEEAPVRPVPPVTPEDLAYVIFTSGSTGTPKGVMMRHGPVLNLIRWVNETFDVGPSDRVLVVASVTFDLSVYDIFGVLGVGGSVLVARDEDIRDPEALMRLLCEGGATFWDSAPAALQQLVPSFPSFREAARASRLRLVFLSGDWIPVTLPDQVRETFPGACVVALGGATEAAIWSNFHVIGEVRPSWVSIPYGRPIQNARYLVLGNDLAPCPAGVRGDLYIGGDCLTAGYAREPELTAQKLVPDPFSDHPGERLYRTGDQARYWPDGVIEFLGRQDHQVKVRGYRIELGEIETTLGSHPAVREGVVVAPAAEGGHRRLVAYLVPASDTPPSIDELRAFLARTLPEYMVPGVFVFLDALPVTSNGKVDRRALLEQGELRPAMDGEHTPPRTPLEEVLASVWRQALGLETVSIHDNFFHLGGDSILSVQIAARAQQAGVRITPRQVFEYPTIADLATVAVAVQDTAAEQAPAAGPAPLTPIQRWFFEQGFADPHHFNLAILFAVRPALHPAVLTEALGHLLAHHDALRLRFARVGNDWEQIGTDPGEAPSVITVDLRGLESPLQTSALAGAGEQLQASFDLEKGPLVRAASFDLGGSSGRLLLAVHHLVVDGVSWRILIEDLETVCRQIEQGGPVSLPPRTTSFLRWARLLRDLAASGRWDPELAYWASEARLGVAGLPVDWPIADAADRVANERAVSQQLDPEMSRVLLQEVPRAYGAGMNIALLTALVQALAAWSGERLYLIDIEGHGREPLADDLDLQRTVGWFTSMFPALIELSPEASPGEALVSVKEQMGRVPGGGIGYGLLRFGSPGTEAAERLRSLPAAQVSFNYLGQFDSTFQAGGRFAPAPESSGPATSSRRHRTHALEVAALVSGGRLQVRWTYSQARHDRATIERLAASFANALLALAEDCQQLDARRYTPGDFMDVDLTQQELDGLLSEVGAE
jgi:amino acid adenylation domain-containing protein/non-ribosomal peptide synthase protein (TIGR01720 family)